MYDNFLQNQQIGYFTGKGSQPVHSSDANHKNCLLQIEMYDGQKKNKKPRGFMQSWFLFLNVGIFFMKVQLLWLLHSIGPSP